MKNAVAALILATILLAPLLQAVPASAAPSYSEVYSAYIEGKRYIERLARTVYDPATGEPVYSFIAEYPSLPVWGRYGEYEWVPGMPFYQLCSSGVHGFYKVHLSLASETLGSTYSRWVYDYTLQFVLSTSRGATVFDLAVLRVAEEHYGGSWRVTVSTLSYGSWEGLGSCGAINGRDITVYLASMPLGTVGSLYTSPATFSFDSSTVLPAFRFSARHVLMLGTLFYDAFGVGNLYMDNAARDILYEVFKTPRDPLDLYGNALPAAGYTVSIDIPALDSDSEDHEYFFDAMLFELYPGYYETGYDRIFRWTLYNGWVDASGPGVYYPLYPYKSKVVSYAELFGVNGGDGFLSVLERPLTCGLDAETDPLLNAWKGIYYAVTGSWGAATSQWYDIVDDWDGVGVLACYSENYSTVRLAAAVMLGTLLAERGYIGWGTVDAMVEALLKAQWRGSGYYKPTDTWEYMFKIDHAGGFIVAYNVAPDGSFGVTGFRPDYLELITEGNDMDPEYIGPLPTNAETTLAAITALKMYMDARYS
ncbi:hypothetical protein ASQ66_gp26 [Aeropyrum pernix spindle-shaped virus 1]|uniref:Uncharacterized protein n=1 Tax=Aeropyrum pernix (strain ATCC 700893 / DSM 11879 / JCM 9820 / NBRC 100138 / K1) TaxID=272557 RepID=Q9YDQ9_AERPE|nr:hypothetical protein [Aeropyrum pernix]YP_009177756.1 hypothetical protein ASQ66_gp26 [Aeropyrum pernix spindle-shaped virus 1]BAA79838.1 hypothetical protein APE_0858 [Aeropyrum pernix spindle-shaped virus 1] [Aeropyrum pernix K1]CCD22114.1 TPA: hypothetical protein [Aeropyrum pernix spindle-shaped virus 1]